MNAFKKVIKACAAGRGVRLSAGEVAELCLLQEISMAAEAAERNESEREQEGGVHA